MGVQQHECTSLSDWTVLQEPLGIFFLGLQSKYEYSLLLCAKKHIPSPTHPSFTSSLHFTPLYHTCHCCFPCCPGHKGSSSTSPTLSNQAAQGSTWAQLGTVAAMAAGQWDPPPCLDLWEQAQGGQPPSIVAAAIQSSAQPLCSPVREDTSSCGTTSIPQPRNSRDQSSNR